MFFIYKLLLLGFIIIFREYIYIFVTVKRKFEKRKKHKPYPNRPTRGPTPNLACALAPPCGRRLLLPLPQPPPTLSSSLSLHAPNSLRALVIHRAPLATRLLPCSLRICPLGDLARWLCASTPDRRATTDPVVLRPASLPQQPSRHPPAVGIKLSDPGPCVLGSLPLRHCTLIPGCYCQPPSHRRPALRLPFCQARRREAKHVAIQHSSH
jgi:hypothetical protein